MFIISFLWLAAGLTGAGLINSHLKETDRAYDLGSWFFSIACGTAIGPLGFFAYGSGWSLTWSN